MVGWMKVPEDLFVIVVKVGIFINFLEQLLYFLTIDLYARIQINILL